MKKKQMSSNFKSLSKLITGKEYQIQDIFF